MIAAVLKKYPQAESRVRVWNVAMPLTYERYLRTYKGSWMYGGISAPGGPTPPEEARPLRPRPLHRRPTFVSRRGVPGDPLSLSPVWCERQTSRFKDDKRASTFSILFATPHEGGGANRTKEGMQHGRIERELES